MKTTPRIVAVAGNMGSGKSSLVEWLRQQFGMVPFFEPNEENPYLSDFYADMPRWALNSQLFFLVRRFQIHRAVVRRAAEDPRPVVQDRTLYEDAEIFAAHLHQAGYIDDRDWTMYQDLYRTLRDEIRPPDLMIYLRCPLRSLTRRIKRRGSCGDSGLSVAGGPGQRSFRFDSRARALLRHHRIETDDRARGGGRTHAGGFGCCVAWRMYGTDGAAS